MEGGSAYPRLTERMGIRNRRTYINIQVKKKAFKINAKIEDVGLNED